MRRKHLIIGIIVAVVIIIGAVVLRFLYPACSNSAESGAGREVLLEDWHVTFQLPSSIRVTEIRTTNDTAKDAEVRIISDSVVAKKYDHEKCSGANVELGELFSVYRYKTYQSGSKKIGGAYYKIAKAIAAPDCYDSTTRQTYFNDSVRATAANTLKAAH